MRLCSHLIVLHFHRYSKLDCSLWKICSCPRWDCKDTRNSSSPNHQCMFANNSLYEWESSGIPLVKFFYLFHQMSLIFYYFPKYHSQLLIDQPFNFSSCSNIWNIGDVLIKNSTKICSLGVWHLGNYKNIGVFDEIKKNSGIFCINQLIKI